MRQLWCIVTNQFDDDPITTILCCMEGGDDSDSSKEYLAKDVKKYSKQYSDARLELVDYDVVGKIFNDEDDYHVGCRNWPNCDLYGCGE